MKDREIAMSFSDLETCDTDYREEYLIVGDNDEDKVDSRYVLNELKDSVSEQKSNESSDAGIDCLPQVNITSQFLSVPHGLVLRATYEHGKRNTEIMGVTYNERMRQFIILDTKGITTWKRNAVDARVHRALSFPKYEYCLITNMVYAKKYNCYFILGKDFSLKVYNRDFIETCSVNADLRSVLFMLFNPIRDELITGGVGGTKVWHFLQQSANTFGDLKTHTNYELTLKYELPNVGGSWVKRVELDHQMEHLYFCSEHNLYTYNLDGKLLFKFERAHSMSITGCRYSRNATVLVTSSLDSEVKVWSLFGGLVHTFRGHSRAVTNLILHPMTSSIVITCSLDGTVRMWSLDTMDCLYSLVASVDGIQWMGLTDDNVLYVSTPRTLTLWHLNYTVQFWALTRSQVTRMIRCGCQEKTTRIMAISEDSSVRLMARSNSKCLTTVLPPPNISPLQRVLSVSYNRHFNIIYMLISSHEIWIYTARTDPACRIAVWHMIDIQQGFTAMHSGMMESKDNQPILASTKSTEPDKSRGIGVGNEVLARCCSIAVLASAVIIWTNEGYCCPTRDSYLLLGLEDGRIIFMDPVKKGHKHLEFKTGKDPVLNMCHDEAHNGLFTLHVLKGMIKILVWCIPNLTLQHEVYAPTDLIDFARESNTLVTVHDSGCVIFQTLEPAGDLSFKARIPTYEEMMKLEHKPEHQSPVIAVDVCLALRLFCSCSDDGTIKIWFNRVLLTEITLDPSLSAACFLNNRGDLLVGYQKHVFYIDHTKVCPQLTVPKTDVDSFDKESYICEDPSVLYDGLTPNHDQVTLENYLVPFDIEVSKDFLEGRVTLEPDAKLEEVSDDENESLVSVAPTEIYLSPEATPRRRLSFVDLVLDSEVNNYELLKRMKETMEYLADKKKHDAAQVSYEQRIETKINRVPLLHQLHERRKGHIRGDGNGTVKSKSAFNDKFMKRLDVKFSFPRCGNSPESTPESSTPTTPKSLSESEEELKEFESTAEEIDMKMQTMTDLNVVDNETERHITADDKEKPAAVIVANEPFKQKKKFGFADIKIDAETLLKETKKAAPTLVAPKRRPEPVQEKKLAESSTDKKSGGREVAVKKSMMSTSERKMSKNLITLKSKDEPSTQMQTLELKEIDSTFPVQDLLIKDDQLYIEHGEVDASFSPVIDIDSSNTSASDLARTAVESEHISVSDISVPAHPQEITNQDVHRSISRSRSVKTNQSTLQSVADSSYHPDKQKCKNEAKHNDSNILSRGDNSRPRPITADSAIQADYMSVASTGSKDGDSAFRIGLMYKEPQETTDFEDKTTPSMAAVKHIQQTNHTSPMKSNTENLQAVSNASKTKYKSMLRPPLAVYKLYKSDDKEYSENWHERQIERHMFIRMQKELRTQNVQNRQQMMKQTQENLRKVTTEEHSAVRRNSSPQIVPDTNPGTNNIHSYKQTINILTPTPAPSRPHTAIGVCGQYQLQQQNQSKLRMSMTLQHQKHLTQRMDTRIQKQLMSPHGQTLFGFEKPFRFRLQHQEHQLVENPQISDQSLSLDPWLLDPRNPKAMRPRSSKSIPSKCHRYVLITKPNNTGNFPLPTTLEKYLLAIRFPKERERICKRFKNLLLSGSSNHSNVLDN